MILGQARFQDINKNLSEKLEEKKHLIAVHRGSWGGNVIQNTILAYDTALKMGADMVETDVVSTTDGVLYSFHDGNEAAVLGVTPIIKTLSSMQVDMIFPINTTRSQCSRKLNRLSEILEHFTDGTLINIDRAWDIFPQLLKLLDAYEHAKYQVVIKAPLHSKMGDAPLKVLSEHPVKYMFMPICYSLDEVREVLTYQDINTVGIEMIAFDKQSEMFSDEAIRFVHDSNLFAWVNAITLGDVTTNALFGGLDDDISLLKGPDAGWGKLMDKGMDILQTDWPALLYAYRKERLGK